MDGAATWQVDGSSCRWRFALPSIPAGHIIVPSACLGTDARFQFNIRDAQGHNTPLLPVPSKPGEPTKPSLAAASPISAHIDCWHTEQDLSDAHLELSVEDAPPENYLLTISVRPLELASSPATPAGISVQCPLPVTLSQMVGPVEIRNRICSPTCIAMLIGESDRWLSVVEQCQDAATSMYGSWPVAVRTAQRFGAVAAVETVSNWDKAVQLLREGLPVAASIRFDLGELRDAPLQQTAGHLVVVYGLDQGEVLVADPAAQGPAEVKRRYPIEPFSRAWMQRRGAVYIVKP